MSNLPQGVTESSIGGDRKLKLYTIELVARVTVPAHDDDEAIRAAESAVCGEHVVGDGDIVNWEYA